MPITSSRTPIDKRDSKRCSRKSERIPWFVPTVHISHGDVRETRRRRSRSYSFSYSEVFGFSFGKV